MSTHGENVATTCILLDNFEEAIRNRLLKKQEKREARMTAETKETIKPNRAQRRRMAQNTKKNATKKRFKIRALVAKEYQKGLKKQIKEPEQRKGEKHED